MNRIYQGKVTAVEIPNGKDEWKKLDDGESAIWQHHQLFQDAVNYYTLALAAMAAGLKTDLGIPANRIIGPQSPRLRQS
jgi:hypothetical protein